jgi:hypothetical protein
MEAREAVRIRPDVLRLAGLGQAGFVQPKR